MHASRLIPGLLAVAAVCSAVGVRMRVLDVTASSAARVVAAVQAPLEASPTLPPATVATPTAGAPGPISSTAEPTPATDTAGIQAATLPDRAAEPTDAVGSLQASVVLPAALTPAPAKAAALLDAMNAARVADGAALLSREPALDEVALARANNLVSNGYFDHYAPDGESAFSELAARGIRYRLAGENLARNNYADGRTVAAAFDGLMASPGHRANILEPRFTRAGVAVVQSGRMWVYVTVFMD